LSMNLHLLAAMIECRSLIGHGLVFVSCDGWMPQFEHEIAFISCDGWMARFRWTFVIAICDGWIPQLY
jgi:hypothetical protein